MLLGFRRKTTEKDSPDSKDLASTPPSSELILANSVDDEEYANMEACEDISVLKEFIGKLRTTMLAHERLCLQKENERHDAVKREIDSNKRIAQQNEELVVLKEQIKNYSQMIVTSEEAFAERQKQTIELHQSELQAIKQGYESAIRELEGELSASESNLEELRREVATLKTQNTELHDRCQEQQAFLSKAEKEKLVLETKISDIESGKGGEVVELKDQIMKITQRRVDLQARCLDLEHSVEQLQAQIASDKIEQERQQDEIKRLNSQINDLTTDNTHLKTKLRAYLEKEMHADK